MMHYISSKYVTKEQLECHQSHLLLGSQMFYQGMSLCTPWEQYWSWWNWFNIFLCITSRCIKKSEACLLAGLTIDNNNLTGSNFSPLMGKKF